MATFEKRDIAYYLSSKIKKNKEGRKERHYHILCAQFTDRSGYVWLQIIGTSKEIENNNENVIVIEPSMCNAFTKRTRFNCDYVYAIQEEELQGASIRGRVPENVFETLKQAIGRSNKVKPIYKKRMNIVCHGHSTSR
ncbi:MAG: hypothetical protein OYG31_02335 [Candidatus Kaiserbacteria bacterium]|nr:hypothetical protein [Candidatus Kaiserbacteria bacterium]